MLAFVRCFNSQLFYEAHEVLEELWLPNRQGLDGPFYKGLIQLAGAFVHLQKRRAGPAEALLLLAQANLKDYPNHYHGVDVAHIKAVIDKFLGQLKGAGSSTLTEQPCEWPVVSLA